MLIWTQLQRYCERTGTQIRSINSNNNCLWYPYNMFVMKITNVPTIIGYPVKMQPSEPLQAACRWKKKIICTRKQKSLNLNIIANHYQSNFSGYVIGETNLISSSLRWNHHRDISRVIYGLRRIKSNNILMITLIVPPTKQHYRHSYSRYFKL